MGPVYSVQFFYGLSYARIEDVISYLDLVLRDVILCLIEMYLRCNLHS